MKFSDTLILGVKLSILVIIIALIAMPWMTKNSSAWISKEKQITEVQNIEPVPKEVKAIETKTSKPIYRTFGTVKLKEVYTYPKHGFYVYEYNKSDMSLELDELEKITGALKYSNEGWLTVYIYDKKVDKAPFWNASKQLPANLIIEADRQFPHVRLMSLKDHSDSLCAYNYFENRAIYYFRSFATGGNWTQPGDVDGNCKLLIQ